MRHNEAQGHNFETNIAHFRTKINQRFDHKKLVFNQNLGYALWQQPLKKIWAKFHGGLMNLSNVIIKRSDQEFKHLKLLVSVISNIAKNKE